KCGGSWRRTAGAGMGSPGVPPTATTQDAVGAGRRVVLPSRTSSPCCSASLDGTLLAVGRAVSFGPGLVNGEIISAQSIGLGGGASVHRGAGIPEGSGPGRQPPARAEVHLVTRCARLP